MLVETQGQTAYPVDRVGAQVPGYFLGNLMRLSIEIFVCFAVGSNVILGGNCYYQPSKCYPSGWGQYSELALGWFFRR